MKSLACLIFLSLLCLCCSSAPAIPQRFPVSELRASTVALVDSDGDIYCSGVWVGPREILTAAHCIHEDYAFFIRDELDPGHIAVLQKIDPEVDLALLRSAIPLYHSTAAIALNAPGPGAPIDIIGHPAGIPWTFAHGWVSGDSKGLLQLSAPVFFGNSGGGAFNSAGELVGIAHSVATMRIKGTLMLVPNVSFFVDTAAIRGFLAL